MEIQKTKIFRWKPKNVRVQDKKLAQISQNLTISKCFELNDFFKFGKKQITAVLVFAEICVGITKIIVDKISMYVGQKKFIRKEREEKVNQEGYLIKRQY